MGGGGSKISYCSAYRRERQTRKRRRKGRR